MPEMPHTIGQRGDRHRVVERRERRLHVPAHAGVQRQGRRHPPGVLDEGRVVVQLAVAAPLAEERVLVGLGIERRLAVDRGDAAGEQRVERARVAEIVRRRAREVRRAEHAGRGIVGRVEAERDARHHLLIVVPRAAEERGAAEREAVPALLPGERCRRTCTDRPSGPTARCACASSSRSGRGRPHSRPDSSKRLRSAAVVGLAEEDPLAARDADLATR